VFAEKKLMPTLGHWEERGGYFMVVVNWLIKNIFTQSAIIMGLIALLGLTAAKKDFNTILQGFLKVVIGWAVYQIGISAFTSNMNPLMNMMSKAFNAPSREIGFYWENNFAYIYGPVIILGFLLHLLIERFIVPEKWRYVFLGGGHFLLREAILTTCLVSMLWGVEQAWLVILISTILSAIQFTVQPAVISPFIRKLRGDDLMGFAHQSSIACLVTSVVVSKVGNPEKSSEDVKFPKAFGFMRDFNCTTTVIMALLMIAMTIIIGPAKSAEIQGTSLNPFIACVMTAVNLSAAMAVLFYGMRMFIAEILPAFVGFADRIVPGARPAMDVPTIFGFGQNAVLFGIVSSTITHIIWMLIINALGIGLIMAPNASLFMSGAGCAVFGNKFGGRRGAIIGGIICGTMMAWGHVLAQYLGGDIYWANARIGYGAEAEDLVVLWPLYWLLGKLANLLGLGA